MQNFKQYLQEGETQNSVYLECCYYFPGNPITDITSAKVRGIVSPVLKGFKFSLQDVSTEGFVVVIIDPDSNWLKSEKAQFDLHGKIMEAVCSEYKMNFAHVINHHKFSANCNIGLNRLLPFQVVCHLLSINVQVDTVFTNIKKLVKCDAIHIYQMEYFNGGLLGLLQIPHPTQVWFSSNSIRLAKYDKLNEAIRIVRTHLDGDRNVVACQRELIEKDLDEYAEL